MGGCTSLDINSIKSRLVKYRKSSKTVNPPNKNREIPHNT